MAESMDERQVRLLEAMTSRWDVRAEQVQTEISFTLEVHLTKFYKRFQAPQIRQLILKDLLSRHDVSWTRLATFNYLITPKLWSYVIKKTDPEAVSIPGSINLTINDHVVEADTLFFLKVHIPWLKTRVDQLYPEYQLWKPVSPRFMYEWLSIRPDPDFEDLGFDAGRIAFQLSLEIAHFEREIRHMERWVRDKACYDALERRLSKVGQHVFGPHAIKVE